ncbi:MAG TPA: CBS domain-containing protein [Candidatus Tumulicola sp.]|nr:CBS domain-containing protein [Candidatus Tumulicola sp.]
MVELHEAYVSELIGRPVKLWTEGSSMPIGKVHDVVVDGREEFPPVTGLYIKCRDGGMRFAQFSSVRAITDKEVILNAPPRDAEHKVAADDELLLNRELLDKQIVDVDGRKVVRVNDVKLAPAGDQLRIIAADIGASGLLRRLGLSGFSKHLLERSTRLGVPRSLISWDSVQPLSRVGPTDSVRLRVPSDKIERIHPVDMAAIIEELNASDQASLVSSLDEETAADAFEQLDVNTQLSILEDLKPERAADIIENMSSDDAADLLAEVEPDKQRQLLNLMEPDEAKDVRELLAHDEATAGGIMTTEFLSVPPGLTVGETFEHIRKAAPDAELVYYVYVLDQSEHLLGVLSLRDLVGSDPSQPTDKLIQEHVVSVPLSASREEVAAVIARYDFVAVPVVDDEGHMHGIVTVDDALDVVLPERLRKMLPRVGKSRSGNRHAHAGQPAR